MTYISAYRTRLNGTERYGTARYDMVTRQGTLPYRMVQQIIVRYGTVRYNVMRRMNKIEARFSHTWPTIVWVRARKIT